VSFFFLSENLFGVVFFFSFIFDFLKRSLFSSNFFSLSFRYIQFSMFSRISAFLHLSFLLRTLKTKQYFLLQQLLPAP